MNLKITNIQIATYSQKQQLPNLQDLADGLCQDEADEIEYVFTESQHKQANLEKIEVGEAKSIFTKIREYPYEFEINSSLQLASINEEQVSIPEGYMKIPTETKTITENGEDIDVLNYAKVSVNVSETTGKGIDWDSGYFDIAAHNTYTINLGFQPSYICFTNRTNGSSVLYNTKLSADKQYINGVKYSLNTEGTSIISVGSVVVFRSNYDLIWDWVALP